jgi:hypothetical protein
VISSLNIREDRYAVMKALIPVLYLPDEHVSVIHTLDLLLKSALALAMADVCNTELKTT